MNILVPGGCGYIGAWLVPQLLAEGHRVTVLDTMWFGTGHLPENGNLTVIEGDVRGTVSYDGFDAVIYFASISSDAMCEANYKLSNSVNSGSFPANVAAAKKAGVKRFIYASSVAGYCDDNATEAHHLYPVTLYANAKAACEEVLRAHQSDDFCTTSVRSASVCGYSPNQRLDITASMMVHHAVRNGVITVNGGEQKRCHVHIRDICDFYKLLLTAPKESIAGQAFNVVAENEAVKDTARQVANAVGSRIIIQPRTDDRSYSVDGTKAREVLGFVPKKRLADAIHDLKIKFDSGYWPDSMTNPAYMRMADGLA